jgi:hypothetical protein
VSATVVHPGARLMGQLPINRELVDLPWRFQNELLSVNTARFSGLVCFSHALLGIATILAEMVSLRWCLVQVVSVNFHHSQFSLVEP